MIQTPSRSTQAPRDTRPLPTQTKVAAAAVVLLILTTACNFWREAPYFDIVNDTDQVLVLFSTNSVGEELDLDTLEPGEKYSYQTSGCYPAKIEARTTDDRLFAQQPEQLCADDTWTITEPDL